MFSSRVPSDLTHNRLTRARARHVAALRPLLDLTQSNPTRAGFVAPPSLLAALGDPAAGAYAPHPRGLETAREAVAADHERRGIVVDPAHIVLTASTSEAYGFLFKVLCDAGDEVLVPRPSYPLFDHLTALENVRAVSYALRYDGAWHVDVDEVAAAFGPRTRALLVVSPNNPTGGMMARSELDALAALCAARQVALVSDEVFVDYPLEPRASVAASALDQGVCLTFALGGLSKSVALPQVKLGWIALGGPASDVEQALERLDFITDTYLSVSTPVQVALPHLLREGASMRAAVAARVRRNYHAVGAALASDLRSPCTRLRAEGGWSVVVQVPAVYSDEELSLGLLDNEGVLVHPGYFYDFPRDGFVALSLLGEPTVFDEGVSRLMRYTRRLVAGDEGTGGRE